MCTRTKANEQQHNTYGTNRGLRGRQLISLVLFILAILAILSGSCRPIRPGFVFELQPSSTRNQQQAGIQFGRGQGVDELCLVPGSECADRLVLDEHSAFDEPVCLVKVPSQGLSSAPFASFAAKSSPLRAPRPRR